MKEGMGFCSFLQFEFYEEWMQLKDYANRKGIRIIGDIPIYVSPDSSDVWADPELFQLDEDRRQTASAGCPPDDFSATGQLWGNPLYNWDYHKKTGFAWWLKRLKNCFDIYDVMRISWNLPSTQEIPAARRTIFPTITKRTVWSTPAPTTMRP